jgi:hypothetical protein
MNSAICIVLALLSLAVSIFCFGNLLASCSGHPPVTSLGIWIMPLSLLGGAVFLYLSIFSFKAKGHRAQSRGRKEAKLLPKKVCVFLASFIVAAMTYFLLSMLMLALAIGTEGTIEDWISYVLYPIFIFGSIYIGVTVYRKLGNLTFNKSVEKDRAT